MSTAYLVTVCTADEWDELRPEVGAEVDDVGVRVALGSDSTHDCGLTFGTEIKDLILTLYSRHCKDRGK